MDINDIINTMPKGIKEQVDELTALVDEYPKKIPVNKAAKFLSMDTECLKRMIEQGTLPFAVGCENGSLGNRYSYISSPKFYMWYMQPVIGELGKIIFDHQNFFTKNKLYANLDLSTKLQEEEKNV